MRLRFQPVRLAHLLIGACALGLSMATMAQTANTSTPSSDNKVKTPVSTVEAGPKWAELNADQQASLSPLQHLWSGLEENRKRKWLAIAKTFPTLSPQAQATAQERMKEWAALSPAQRSQARLNFAQSQQLSTDEKKAKWEAYQALNEEEKQKLATAKSAFPKSAATAPKPIAPEKLTTTPSAKEGQSKAPRIETTEVHPRTLLPVRKTNLSISADK